jgi:hypothetical protein
MLRFYRTWAERLLIAMIYLQKREDTAMGDKTDIIATVKGFRTDNPAHADVVYRALDSYIHPQSGDDPTNAEVIEGTLGQFGKKKSDDLDLIDTIVRTLQLPYSANHFSGSYVKMLRDAILRPEELMKWRKNNTVTLKCECGREFNSGEMVTAHNAGDGTIKFLCHQCAKPVYTACRHCDKLVIIKNGFHPSKQVSCGCQERAQAIAQAATAAPEQPTLNAAMRRAMRRAAMQGDNATVATPAPVEPIPVYTPDVEARIGGTMNWRTIMDGPREGFRTADYAQIQRETLAAAIGDNFDGPAE